MTQQNEMVIDHNPTVLGFRIQEMVQNGWVINPAHPLTQLGFLWEIGFVREVSDEQLAEEAARPVKLTRAEILARAREAKAANRAERKQEEAASV